MERLRPRLVLTEQDREQLEDLANSRSVPAYLGNRARIILLGAGGMTNRQIARRLGIAKATVRKWHDRFVQLGVSGLHDTPRPGRLRSIGNELVAKLPPKTLQVPPGPFQSAKELVANSDQFSRSSHTQALRLVRTAPDDSISGKIEDISWRAHYLLRLVLVAGIAGFLALSGWVVYLTRPRRLNINLTPCLPIVKLQGNRLAIQVRTDALLARVSDYNSELEAYLHFEYLKTHLGLASSRVLLAVKNTDTGPRYQIFLVLDNNLLSDVPYLTRAIAKGYIPDYKLCPVTFQNLARKRLETAVFLGSYNPTTTPRLASLPPARLLIPLANFLVFKSRTDRRVREHIPPVPTTLSFPQAKELAADILDVVHFYNLPLDVFLGIGAMENNYMNVRGDLDHAVWKRHAQRGDIILRRVRGRVLVSDYAMGVWQITRETLRRAHALYLQDKRDYSALPPRLRPPKKFSFDLDNSEVLTTYAGLLLRHLLDKSDGDVAKAVGAYNGSLQRPNYQYAAGVEAVALYARDFLERAANLDGLNVAKSWLVHRSSLARGEEVATSASPPSHEDLSLRSE